MGFHCDDRQTSDVSIYTDHSYVFYCIWLKWITNYRSCWYGCIMSKISINLFTVTGISVVPMKQSFGTGWSVSWKHRYQPLHGYCFLGTWILVGRQISLDIILEISTRQNLICFSEWWLASSCDETPLFIWYLQAKIWHHALSADSRRRE